MHVFVLQRGRQGITENSQCLVIKELVCHAPDIPKTYRFTEWESGYYFGQVYSTWVCGVKMLASRTGSDSSAV